jgi:hypothetical protein
MTDQRPQEGDRHPHSEEPEEAGSGTSSPETGVKRQAGSYSRDAEQDPSAAPPSETEE